MSNPDNLWRNDQIALLQNAFNLSKKVLGTQHPDKLIKISYIINFILKIKSKQYAKLQMDIYKTQINIFEQLINTTSEDINTRNELLESFWGSLKKYIPYSLLLGGKELSHATDMLRILISTINGITVIEEDTPIALCWKIFEPTLQNSDIAKFKSYLKNHSETATAAGSQPASANVFSDADAANTLLGLDTNNTERKRKRPDDDGSSNRNRTFKIYKPINNFSSTFPIQSSPYTNHQK